MKLKRPPAYASAHGRTDQVKAAIQRAIAQSEGGDIPGAISTYRRVLALDPNQLSACANLGGILTLQGEVAEAEALLMRAYARAPQEEGVRANLATNLLLQGRYGEASQLLNLILARNPENHLAQTNTALLRLKLGDFDRGWCDLERVRARERQRRFSTPYWSGQSLPDGVLFVHSEAGFGDTLHFLRYLPAIKARCNVGRVIFGHQPQLSGLLDPLPGVDTFVTDGDPVPDHTAHVGILSLPYLLRTGADMMGEAVPYLTVGEAKRAEWRSRLGADPALRVGVVWAGTPTFAGDRFRSCRLADLAPLASVSGVRFFSLQKGDAARQASRWPVGLADLGADLGADLHTFADTAAAILSLDLVITVDTAVAHLAGALSCPVWTLLPLDPDWRWQLDRDDSDLYPTMRLFRQDRVGDWASVVRRVAAHLETLAQERTTAAQQ